MNTASTRHCVILHCDCDDNALSRPSAVHDIIHADPETALGPKQPTPPTLYSRLDSTSISVSYLPMLNSGSLLFPSRNYARPCNPSLPFSAYIINFSAHPPILS